MQYIVLQGAAFVNIRIQTGRICSRNDTCQVEITKNEGAISVFSLFSKSPGNHQADTYIMAGMLTAEIYFNPMIKQELIYLKSVV